MQRKKIIIALAALGCVAVLGVGGYGILSQTTDTTSKSASADEKDQADHEKEKTTDQMDDVKDDAALINGAAPIPLLRIHLHLPSIPIPAHPPAIPVHPAMRPKRFLQRHMRKRSSNRSATAVVLSLIQPVKPVFILWLPIPVKIIPVKLSVPLSSQMFLPQPNRYTSAKNALSAAHGSD